MKFAICNETYRNWPLERLCAHVAECGYEGLEIAPFTLRDSPWELTERDAAAVGRIVTAAGLEVVGLHWLLLKPAGLHLTSPDAAVRQRTTEFARHLVRLCAAMGGQIMVWGSPAQRRIGPEECYGESFARARDLLRQVAETAGPLGVTVALEPLAPSETNFLTTAEEAINLIEAIGHPACRLHLDVKAMSSEREPIPQVIRRSRGHLAHFHANDPNGQGPGFGAVDFGPIAAALREISYDRFVSVEVFNDPVDPETTATKSLAYLRRHFEPVTEH